MTIFEIAAISAVTATLLAVLTNMVNAFIASLPRRIWKYLVRTFTASVTIDKEDYEFPLIIEWVLQQPYGKTMHNVRRAWSREQMKYIMAPGIGHHLLKFEEKPILITYSEVETEENSGPGSVRVSDRKYFRIMTFGRDRERIQRFMEILEKLRKPDDSRQDIMNWRSDYWRHLPSKRKRGMNTIYIDQKVHQEVIKRIDTFLKGEEYYMVRGIPYRLGISLEGPPGTGKTTYAICLAGLYIMLICIMNIAAMHGDNDLMTAFANAPRSAIILVEDVHTSSNTANRKGGTTTVVSESKGEVSDGPANTAPAAATKEEEKKSMTLGGLLNAIDGVAASEGRILIMTTNYPERLDPALVRSGRIDKRVFIGNLPAEEVERMFTVFFPEHANRSKEVYRHALHIEKPCAWWQEQFLKNQDSIDQIFACLADINKCVEIAQSAAGGR